MRYTNSSQRRELSNRVAGIARAVARAAAAATTLGDEAPASIPVCERDLWRWADTLRDPLRSEAPTQHRFVAAVLLIELPDGPRDPGWLAQAITQTARSNDGGWHVRHASIYPDYAAAFGDPAALLRDQARTTDRPNDR